MASYSRVPVPARHAAALLQTAALCVVIPVALMALAGCRSAHHAPVHQLCIAPLDPVCHGYEQTAWRPMQGCEPILPLFGVPEEIPAQAPVPVQSDDESGEPDSNLIPDTADDTGTLDESTETEPAEPVSSGDQAMPQERMNQNWIRLCPWPTPQ